MQRILAFFFLFAFASAASGQQETLLGRGVEHGGFGAPVWKISGVNGDIVPFGGARGGWIINHTFIIGYGTYGMGGEVDASSFARRTFARPNLELDFRYRGLEFEYVNDWDKLFHWGLYTLVGGGSANYLDPNDDDFDIDDNLFIIEPAVNGTLNVTRWFRATAQASYRFVGDVDLVGVSSGDLGGPALTVELRFGKF